MYKSEKKGQKIDRRKPALESELFLGDITQRRNHNGDWYQKLDPGRGNRNIIEGTQGQGDRMADCEGCNKYQDLFPVIKSVTEAKGKHKDNMIVTSKICNVLKS